MPGPGVGDTHVPEKRKYTPSDRLYLWLLTEPTRPLLVGELNLVRASQGVSLRYAESWLRGGFALSEDLPLIEQEFMPAEKALAAGAVDDARPDRWGERVIRFIDKPARLSLLEYLYFAGDDRFGALGVSASASEYLPRRLGPLPTLADADRIHELVGKVMANEPVPQVQKRLISPGATMGGARPKALVSVAGEQWVIKFADGEPIDTPLIEHASMSGVSIGSPSANLMTHCSPATLTSALGRAPPMVAPGEMSRFCTCGTGSFAMTLPTSSWMRSASASVGNAPSRRGRYSLADVDTPSAPKRSSPAK